MGGHNVEPWYSRPGNTFYISIPYPYPTCGSVGPASGGLQGARSRRLATGSCFLVQCMVYAKPKTQYLNTK